ncbi:PaaD-like zinc ribbon domain-containing protein [Spirillospora sp. CA-128828]|uniref:PaaD-like zinc ribbon domain-containing protein n=1 Tax=Spirillospora sp. CA-128828 TaxID=3240033 RepID=UPI003D923C6D
MVTARERAVRLAGQAAGQVRDPEMPMLTLADLGVLRGVDVDPRPDGDVVIAHITPTYTGCPAMATMRDDLVHRLNDAGFPHVEVRVVLDPPWSSDWISERGRAALREAGLSPPGPVSSGGTTPHTPRQEQPGRLPPLRRSSAPGTGPASGRPVGLVLGPVRLAPRCPRCGSASTRLTSEFGATACKALYTCTGCLEPFEHVKEI